MVVHLQDFRERNVPKRVLSSTKHSYIICNIACHDTRLYASDIDPSSSDKTAAAGMSYMHLLVIPSSKGELLGEHDVKVILTLSRNLQCTMQSRSRIRN